MGVIGEVAYVGEVDVGDTFPSAHAQRLKFPLSEDLFEKAVVESDQSAAEFRL